MRSESNRLRDNWQRYANAMAADAEINFFNCFSVAFEGTEYRIRSKPKEFNNIYVNIKLTEQDRSEIYAPPELITRHGIYPDFAIDNLTTVKSLYVESKRQDGWVEGGARKDGRGNAHERSCKFFTPGLLKIMQKESGIEHPNLPFWTVFQGNITRDPCRVREIACWYEGYENHYFFWRNTNDPEKLLNHFEEKLAHILW